MVEHRRRTSKPAFVPPGWVVFVGVVLCVVGSGWLGTLLVIGGPAIADPAPQADSSPSASATPTTEAPTSATPTTPSPTPTPTEEPTPEVERDAPVSVLNNTGIGGLADRFAGQVRQAGWTVAGVGNWNGVIESNTVYYPEALEEQGRLLAEDIGITRILPSIDPMRTDRLTIILSGPQQ